MRIIFVILLFSAFSFGKDTADEIKSKIKDEIKQEWLDKASEATPLLNSTLKTKPKQNECERVLLSSYIMATSQLALKNKLTSFENGRYGMILILEGKPESSIIFQFLYDGTSSKPVGIKILNKSDEFSVIIESDGFFVVSNSKCNFGFGMKKPFEGKAIPIKD